MTTLKVTSLDVGISLTRFTDLDETPAQNISDDECNLYGYHIINPNASAVYVKFYNLDAGDVTVGTSPIIRTIEVPANSSINVGASGIPQLSADVALSVAATGALADNDTTAITTDLVADFIYG